MPQGWGRVGPQRRVAAVGWWVGGSGRGGGVSRDPPPLTLQEGLVGGGVGGAAGGVLGLAGHLAVQRILVLRLHGGGGRQEESMSSVQVWAWGKEGVSGVCKGGL
jgi:hypothetical protein